jgi:regulatory protein YycI of two-component signal transduction system YycFG
MAQVVRLDEYLKRKQLQQEPEAKKIPGAYVDVNKLIQQYKSGEKSVDPEFQNFVNQFYELLGYYKLDTMNKDLRNLFLNEAFAHFMKTKNQ